MSSPSPLPDPTVDELTPLIEQLVAFADAVAVVFLTIAVVVFGAMLLRAARYPWPVPIIAPIAMLTLVFGLAGVAADSLVPLAGAGLGALAGVLTAQLGKRPDTPHNPDPPTDEPEDPVP
jgi:energy-converting hydrogenase Eha subunit A